MSDRACEKCGLSRGLNWRGAVMNEPNSDECLRCEIVRLRAARRTMGEVAINLAREAELMTTRLDEGFADADIDPGLLIEWLQLLSAKLSGGDS